MKIFLVRHGQDDDSVRGGWSNSPLTDMGVQQSIDLADEIFNHSDYYNIGAVFSSDIVRAQQTAAIIARKLNLPVSLMSGFREVNNGNLAGLNNKLAEIEYPNLYWRKLEWEEHYPNGESPKEFYDRVSNTWREFTHSFENCNNNVLLVTHGGVINIIKCMISKTEYSNKEKYQDVPSGQIVLEIEI